MYRDSRNHILIGIVILFLSMISGQHVQGETTQQHEYEQHQEKILLSLAQTLAQLRVEGVEGYDPRIPVNVRPLLMNLKHGLRDLIRVTLNNTHFQWESPDEITAHSLSTLQSHNISFRESWEEDARYYTYDDLEDIQLLQSLQHPNLLIATTRLWVMCGSDTSFYLFQKSGEQWQLVVAQEANNYEEISGAQGAFQYAISPPDVTGDFYIVTANINPWCSSNWQSLRYKAFRVGATPSQPKMLAQGEETIYKVTGYTITTHATKFWLLFAGDVSEYQVPFLCIWSPMTSKATKSKEYILCRKIFWEHGFACRGKKRQNGLSQNHYPQ